MCASRITGRFEPFPGSRATSWARPGDGSKRCDEIPSFSKIPARNCASGSSLPGGFVVSKRISCRSSMTTLSMPGSGFKKRLDLSHQRSEGELGADPIGYLVGGVALAGREQISDDPRAGGGIAMPVEIEAAGEIFIQARLQLPRAKIARGIESRIDVDEGVDRPVLESGCFAELGHVEIGETRPGNIAAVKGDLIDELCAITTEEVQLLKTRSPQKLPDPVFPELSISREPSGVLHAVVKEHRVRLGHRVVSQPAELERKIGTRVREVESVTELVQECVVVILTAMRAKHEIDFIGNSDRSAKGARALPFPFPDVVTDPLARAGVDA